MNAWLKEGCTPPNLKFYFFLLHRDLPNDVHDVENIEAFPVAEFAITFFCVKIGHTVDELFNFIYEFTHHNQV